MASSGHLTKLNLSVVKCSPGQFRLELTFISCAGEPKGSGLWGRGGRSGLAMENKWECVALKQRAGMLAG